MFGVSLGESKSNVETSLKRQGERPEKFTNSSGKEGLRIKSPILGDCTFEIANFYFKNGVLDEVVFASSDAGMCDASFPGHNGYQQFLEHASSYESIYKSMRADLLDKYGAPVIDTDEKCVWRSGKNQITLTYEFKDVENQYSWHDCYSRVAVVYGARKSSNI